MKIALGFILTKKDWLKLMLIPLLFSILSVFLINLSPKYEATAIIYPSIDKVGNLNKSALKTMKRSSRRLIKLMNRQSKRNNSESIHITLAQLKSVQLFKLFILKYNLKKLLFEDKWDTENQRWRNARNKGEPSLAKAVKKLKKLLKIKYTKKNNLISVKLIWEDPVIAAEIVNNYISFANHYISDEIKRIKIDELNSLQLLISEIRYKDMKQELISQYEAIETSISSESGPLNQQLKVLSPALKEEEPTFRLKPVLIILVFVFSVLCVFLLILLVKNQTENDRNNQKIFKHT